MNPLLKEKKRILAALEAGEKVEHKAQEKKIENNPFLIAQNEIRKSLVNKGGATEPKSTNNSASEEDDSDFNDQEPTELAHYQADMKTDISYLREIKNIDDRLPLKKNLVEKYAEFVNEYVEKGDKYPNSVAVQYLIWLVDTGDIVKAVELGLHLVGQDVHKMPKEFNSSIETFICDYVFDWANDLLAKEQSASPYYDEVYKNVDEWNLSKIVAGKMHKLAGLLAEQKGELDIALQRLNRAQEVNQAAGCKKHIKRVQALMELKK